MNDVITFDVDQIIMYFAISYYIVYVLHQGLKTFKIWAHICQLKIVKY